MPPADTSPGPDSAGAGRLRPMRYRSRGSPANRMGLLKAIRLDRRPDLEARREHGEPYPLARHWSYGAKQVRGRPAGLTLGLIRQGMKVTGSTQHAPFGQKILVSRQ